MSDSDSPAPATKTKKCLVCREEMDADASLCKTCKSAQGPQCVICKQRIPDGAQRCNECDAYQNWRSHFPFITTVLSLILAMIAVSSAVVPAAFYLADRNSDTQLRVTGASEDQIFVKVWNAGKKPSNLASYHLRFNGRMPINETTLHPSDKDQESAKSVIAPGGAVEIKLEAPVEGLETLPPYENADIGKLIANQPVTLRINVEESNDPRPGLCCWIARRDSHPREHTFPAQLISRFISRKAGAKHAQQMPVQP
jgi:hypothetical protein